MPMSSKTLQKYLVQIRRIEEHRSKKAQKNIIRIYKALQSDLRAFLGEEYIKYAEDDVLKYEQLFKRGEYARFLEEVERHINSIMLEEKKIIKGLVEDTYKANYIGMVEAVEKSKALPELTKKLSGIKAVTPETIQRAVTNPISGLTLNDTLEKNRKEIIYGVKQQIGIGLSQGDRYTTMAKRIDDNLNIGYKKAMTIARTESHRVMEEGQLDSALAIDEAVRSAGSDLIYVKTWRTMADEKVRPQMKATKTKGKHSRIGKPNHVKMEDITLAIADKFDLGGGITTNAPLQSGVAGHDINCRCYLEYDFLTAEEYLEKTGKVWEKPLTNDDESGIMKVEEEKTTKKENPTSVDWEIVDSREYKEKFSGISDSKEIDEIICQKARDILKHRENTVFEDMYLINSGSGRIVGTQTHSDVAHSIVYNKSLNLAVRNSQKETLISMHNHPENRLPSGGDFASCFSRKYKKGIIVCHNGDVIIYSTGKKQISSKIYDLTVDKFRQYSLNEKDAYLKALEVLSKSYEIKWEVR